MSSTYRLLKCIGKGSYGSVYIVKNYYKNIYHALKRISTYNLREKEKINLLNEIRILKYCSCPYILKLVDVHANFTNIDIITNYVRKGDFLSIIKKRKDYFDESLVWSYFIQVCLGLKYLHANNIIHRDLKCGNVFLDNGDHVFIGDFGSCKILTYDHQLTSTSVGTPYYMSPEVINREKYSTEADIWGLGCFLFELISFKPPFTASNYNVLTKNIMNEKFNIDISTFKDKFTEELITLVHKILRRKNRLTVKKILRLEEVDTHIYLIPYVTEKSKDIQNMSQKFRRVIINNWYSIVRSLKDPLLYKI
jgi:NIMA (never in mitosis gene a)-related kinase 1/4/5